MSDQDIIDAIAGELAYDIEDRGLAKALARGVLAALHKQHAIVALPKPIRKDAKRTSWEWVIAWNSNPDQLLPAEIRTTERDSLTPTQARSFAAELLAAADAAEADQ